MSALQTIKKIWRTNAGCAAVLAAAALLCCCVRLIPIASGVETVVYDMGDITHYREEYTEYYVPDTELDKGIYTVRIVYQCGADHEVTVEGHHNTGETIQSTPILLSSGKVHEQFRIIVEENDTIACVLIREVKPGPALTAASFRVEYIYMPGMTVSLYAIRTLLPFLVLFFLILLLRYLRKEENPECRYVVCALLLLILFISAPAFLGYVVERNDTAFHMERIGNLSENLFGGSFRYRLQGGWHNGYGYPVAIFYGEVLLLPAAVLYALAVPLWRCYQFTIVFLNTLKVGVGYYAFRKMSDSRRTGLFCCVVYAACEWGLNRAFMSAALGEYSAQIFLPLVVLGFYELLKSDTRWKTELHLIIGFTGLVHTHLITSVLCVILSVVFWGLMPDVLLKEKRWKTLLSAAVMTIAVNLSFLVPFLDYTLRYDLQVEKLQNLVFARTVLDLFMPDYYRGLGPAVLMVLVFSLMVLAGEGQSGQKRGILTLLFTALLSVFMSTVYFPWNWIRGNLPFLYDIMAGRFQHAFRYLTPAMAMICGLVAVLPGKDRENPDHRKEQAVLMAMVSIVAVTIVTGAGLMKYAMVPWEVNGVNGSMDDLDKDVIINVVDLTGEDVMGGGDNLYLRTDMDLEYPRTNLFRDVTAMGDDAEVNNVTRKGTSFSMEVANHSEEEALIVFPVWSYHGYAAKGNGTAFPVFDWGNGTIGVTVPGGYEGPLKLSFQSPWYWRVADMISLLAVVFLVISVRKKMTGRISGNKGQQV